MRIRHLVIRLCLLAAAVLALPIAPAAAQVGNTIVIGGPGGAVDQDQCPDGALLTGMHFSGNKDINTVTPICTTYTNGHAASAPITLRKWGTEYEATYGFGGPTPKTPACPPDTAVEGISVQVSNANVVHSFHFRCRNPLQHLYYDSVYAEVGRGASKYEKYITCGGGAIAIGIVVHHGALIDALGLICKTWIVAAPEKVYKTTGKRKPTPSGPPVALRVTIAGPWKMQTQESDRTNLFLSPQGQGINPFGQDIEVMGMSGQITRPDGADNLSGTLQGAFPPDRLLTFSYVRRNGVAGTCQLAYPADGQTLQGSCTEKGTSFTWSGTRGTWPTM